MVADTAPFELPGDDRGILCVHGFTGTPYEMRPLAEDLNAHGYTVRAMLLPAHGTSTDELALSTWQQWYEGVEAELDELRQRCRVVYAVGQSLGGLLTLHLARTRGDQLSAIACLATPMWLSPMVRALIAATRIPAIGNRLREIPKVGGSDAADARVRRDNPGYRAFPVPALHQLSDFMGMVRRDLGLVRVPTVVVHGRQDHTAPVACGREITRRIGAPRVRRHTLERSFHLVACDVEHMLAAEQVSAFFEQESHRHQRLQPGGQTSGRPTTTIHEG